MKRKWWIIPIAVVLILLVLLAVYWEAIVIHMVPNIVLSKALTNTITSIDRRLANSPVKLLSEVIDPAGGNKLDIQLDTSNSLLGDISYQMDVQMTHMPRCILAQGTVSTADRLQDLSFYADKGFAAVSSDELVDGRFYGITFESFSEDIRNIPLLPLLIGDSTIQQWESFVSDFRSIMEEEVKLPSFTNSEIQTAVMGLFAVKPQVSRDTIPVSGIEQDVYRLTFCASGQQIASVAGDYLKYMSGEILELAKAFANDADSMISIEFYVLDDVVVKIGLASELNGESSRAELILGKDASREDIRAAWIRSNKDIMDKWSMDISSEYSDTAYGESWKIIHIENGVQERTVIAYEWDIPSGAMDLKLNDAAGNRGVLLNLMPTDTGFRLSTDQFEDLMSIVSEQTNFGSSKCVMTVSKGAKIVTPEYKNLDQWTGEDLLSLLGGIGTLFGLTI